MHEQEYQALVCHPHFSLRSIFSTLLFSFLALRALGRLGLMIMSSWMKIEIFLSWFAC